MFPSLCILTYIYNAQKLPQNIMNTKTTEPMVLSQENKHTFSSPVKYLLISTQKEYFICFFSVGKGREWVYSISSQEQSLKFQLKKKKKSSQMDLVPNNEKKMAH